MNKQKKLFAKTQRLITWQSTRHFPVTGFVEVRVFVHFKRGNWSRSRSVWFSISSPRTPHSVESMSVNCFSHCVPLNVVFSVWRTCCQRGFPNLTTRRHSSTSVKSQMSHPSDGGLICSNGVAMFEPNLYFSYCSTKQNVFSFYFNYFLKSKLFFSFFLASSCKIL